MKNLFTALAIFITFATSAQVTTMNRAKITNAPMQTTWDRVLVQDPVSREVGYILKSSLQSAVVFPTGFVTVNPILRTGDTFTFQSGETYNLDNNPETLLANFVTTIATEDEGISRIDVIYALSDGTYAKAVGTPGEIAQKPDIPNGALERTQFNISGDVVEDPIIIVPQVPNIHNVLLSGSYTDQTYNHVGSGYSINSPNGTMRSRNFMIANGSSPGGFIFGGGGENGSGASSAGIMRVGSGFRDLGMRLNGQLFYNAFTKTTFAGREIPDVDFVQEMIDAGGGGSTPTLQQVVDMGNSIVSGSSSMSLSAGYVSMQRPGEFLTYQPGLIQISQKTDPIYQYRADLNGQLLSFELFEFSTSYGKNSLRPSFGGSDVDIYFPSASGTIATEEWATSQFGGSGGSGITNITGTDGVTVADDGSGGKVVGLGNITPDSVSASGNVTAPNLYNKTETDALLAGKVDKDGTKVLSDVNFSTTKDAKLSGIATGATANQSDAVTNAAIDGKISKTTDITGFVKITQAAYTALAVKDATTIYVIVN